MSNSNARSISKARSVGEGHTTEDFSAGHARQHDYRGVTEQLASAIYAGRAERGVLVTLFVLNAWLMRPMFILSMSLISKAFAPGSIFGRDSHLARAVLEATAYQTREVVEAMEMDSKVNLDVLRVDGGMVDDDLLMQFQADILNRNVVRPLIKETTALGSGNAAGLAVEYYKDLDELRANWGVDHTWKPQMESALREHIYQEWKKAATRSFDWAA